MIGVGGGNGSPPDQRPAALLVAAGVVAVDGAALRGFAGWLLRRTSEEPSNRGVFQGATAYVALMGLARAGCRRRAVATETLGLRCRRLPSAARARRGLPDGPRSSGLAPCCLDWPDVAALLALFSAPARAALGRS